MYPRPPSASYHFVPGSHYFNVHPMPSVSHYQRRAVGSPNSQYGTHPVQESTVEQNRHSNEDKKDPLCESQQVPRSVKPGGK